MRADAERITAVGPAATLADWLAEAVSADESARHDRFGLAEGRVVAISPSADRRLIPAVEFRDIVADPAVRSGLHRIDAGHARYLVLVTPVVFGEDVGAHVVAAPLTELEDARRDRLLRSIGEGLALLGAAGAVAAVASHRYATAPVRRRRRPAGDRGPLGVVVAEGFLSRLAFGLLSFSLPLYAHRLGLSLPEIGMLLSTNTAVAIVLKPVMGRVIDRVGVRTAYVFAVALRTLVVLSLVFAAAPLHLFVARGLHGVSIALRDPSAATVLAALGGKKAVAQRFAWYQTAKTVAGSGGQVGAGILLTALAGGFETVFAVATVLSGVPLLLVIAGLRGPRVRGLVLPRLPRHTPLPAALKASLAPYALLGAAMSGTAYLMANLLPVLAVEHMGLSPLAASSMYAFTAVVALSGPAWGWIADRFSLKLVLGVRAVGNVASSLIWLVFPTHAGLIAGKIADDAGKAAFRPAWGAVMARVSALDPPRRAQTLALMSSAEDVGELGAPILAGAVWAAFGLPALLVMRAVAGLAAEAYAWRLGSRGLLDAEGWDEDALTSASSTSPPPPLR